LPSLDVSVDAIDATPPLAHLAPCWRRFADGANYWAVVPLKAQIKRLMHAHQLELTLDRRKALRRAEFVVVSTMRNEAFRMPYFFDYYRALGFQHFILIDNESDDGLVDLSRAREDVTLYTARGSYKTARYGVDWVNHLLAKHGAGKWILHADPDEFLVFPECDRLSVRDLAQRLEAQGRRAFPTMMIDMYSARPITENICRPGQNPLEVCDYFDARPYIESVENPLSVKHIRGGPRARAYFGALSEGPMLNKTPLVRWKSHYLFIRSTNEVWPPNLAGQDYQKRKGMAGALLHFKFLAEFIEKVAEEQSRGQHTSEYQRYQQGINTKAEIVFMHEGSLLYEGWRTLLTCGFIS
jgi:Glycosyl transferase family 2